MSIIAAAKERAKAYESSALIKSEEIIKRQEVQSIEKINQAEIQAMSRIRKTRMTVYDAHRLVSEKISICEFRSDPLR